MTGIEWAPPKKSINRKYYRIKREKVIEEFIKHHDLFEGPNGVENMDRVFESIGKLERDLALAYTPARHKSIYLSEDLSEWPVNFV